MTQKLIISPNEPSELSFKVNVAGTSSAPQRVQIVLSRDNTSLSFDASSAGSDSWTATVNNVGMVFQPGEVDLTIQVLINGKLFTPFQAAAEIVAPELPALASRSVIQQDQQVSPGNEQVPTEIKDLELPQELSSDSTTTDTEVEVSNSITDVSRRSGTSSISLIAAISKEDVELKRAEVTKKIKQIFNSDAMRIHRAQRLDLSEQLKISPAKKIFENVISTKSEKKMTARAEPKPLWELKRTRIVTK